MEKLYHIKQSIFRYNSQLTRKYTLRSLIKLVVAIDLTTHSTHYYQRLNQCHLRLDGHGNMVKDHSDNKRWNNWMGAQDRSIWWPTAPWAKALPLTYGLRTEITIRRIMDQLYCYSTELYCTLPTGLDREKTQYCILKPFLTTVTLASNKGWGNLLVAHWWGFGQC